jgi:genome maintenance exonuclease 1
MKKKKFNHQLVEHLDLKTETINGKRHYVLPDGKTKLKSVTSILSEVLDNSWVEEWKSRVGEEEAKKISTQSTNRGSSIHDIAEKYVKNDENFLDGQMPFNVYQFKPIKKILNKHVDNIRGVEIALYSKALKCAGRSDLIAEYDGVTSVIDYKTSKKIKTDDDIKSYFLQSTIYSMMFEVMYKIPVPQIVIIMTVDFEDEPLVFVKDRGNYINEILRLLA